ncbi:MAG: hypothetical protein JWM69_1422 [Candidatus Binatus sp.]|jgi:hypothetical protein|nr:hypothetical protein [Candidatus Binatus sp.]
MRTLAIVLTLMVFSSSALANCVTNARGRVVCSNGEEAGGYNSKTGNAWHSERNQNGVATTHTSAGGEAKTKNGKGVYQSPNGKDCYRTANSKGCN